jgi:hypothetical protein
LAVVQKAKKAVQVIEAAPGVMLEGAGNRKNHGRDIVTVDKV